MKGIWGTVIAVVIYLLLLGGIFVYYFFLADWYTEGIVSSTSMRDKIWYKIKCIEYFGGDKDCFWSHYDISDVKSGMYCKVKTRGYTLENLECEEVKK